MFNFDPNAVSAAARKCGAFNQSARFWSARVVFMMGSEGYVLEMKDGNVASFQRNDSPPDGDLTISGPAESWAKLLEQVPPPGFQDPLFVAGGAGFSVKGDALTALAPYYHAIQDFLDILRRHRSGSPDHGPQAEVGRDFDAAVGRYMYVHIEGVQYRIYYEEAGEGEIPLLLQHTAGGDGRQWRHLLEDHDYQKQYRMISYDLPFHGRSLPPTTERWWEKQYRLRKSFLREAVLAIAKRLELDRPVFMGCSVGGMLAPDLAFHHPEAFRAVIGINGALGDVRQETPELRQMNELWSNPRVGSQWTSALIRSNIAPTSPECFQRETMWVYSQSAPTVNEGDVYYYAVDYDLSEKQASQIDTSVVGVYLITCEYDGLALDGGTARLAKAITGSHFEIVPGLGHFGAAENPAGLKPALLPILQKIAKADQKAKL